MPFHSFRQWRIDVFYYRPQTKLLEGNVSTPVCLFTQGMMSVVSGLHLGDLHLGDLYLRVSAYKGVCIQGILHPSGGGLCPRFGLSRGGSAYRTPPSNQKSGQYISYWNAFLLSSAERIKFCEKCTVANSWGDEYLICFWLCIKKPSVFYKFKYLLITNDASNGVSCRHQETFQSTDTSIFSTLFKK